MGHLRVIYGQIGPYPASAALPFRTNPCGSGDVMLRRALLPVVLGLTGLSMVVAACVGVGTASAATSNYQLTYAVDGTKTVVVRWASCIRTSAGVKQQVIP